MGQEYSLPRLGKLRILLTQRCNLDCAYCHKEGQFSKRKNITLEEFEKITEIAYGFSLDEIKYSGGEPLLYPGLPMLVRNAKKLGVPSTSVTTNGILLEDRIQELADSGLDELSISLDTVKLETFKKLNRGTQKKFEKIFRGIEKTKNYTIRTNLNMSLTNQNIEEVGSMRQYARSLDYNLRLISFIPLSLEHKKEISADAFNLFNQLKREASSINQNENYPAYTNLLMPDGTKLSLVNSSCFSCDTCGKSYALRVTTDGKLKPCLISEAGEIDVITPLREHDYAEVKKRFVEAIMTKRGGLMKYFSVPIKILSEEFLSED